MKNIFTLLIIGLLFTACGSSNSNKPTSTVAGETQNNNSMVENNSLTEDSVMVIGTKYVVSPGDQILKGSEDAVVRITHIDGQTQSSVVLVEGIATIIVKK